MQTKYIDIDLTYTTTYLAVIRVQDAGPKQRHYAAVLHHNLNFRIRVTDVLVGAAKYVMT